jgi:hypothetical protein
MKRSDMIKHLKEAVFGASYDDVTMEDVEAEDLLVRLEKLGMRPPDVPKDMAHAITVVRMFPDYNMWEEDFYKDEALVTALNRRKARK